MAKYARIFGVIINESPEYYWIYEAVAGVSSGQNVLSEQYATLEEAALAARKAGYIPWDREANSNIIYY